MCPRFSPFTSTFVTGFGSPPEAGTWKSPPVHFCGNTIVSSGAHEPPSRRSNTPHSQIVTGAPPEIETFLIRLSDQKPTHCPSGEKNGV